MDLIVSQYDRSRPGLIRALAVGLAAASLVVGCNGAVPTTVASTSLSAVSPSFAAPGGSTLTPSPSVGPSASYPPGVIFEGAVYGGNVTWSPKGARVAVLAGASGTTPSVSIVDPAGRVEDQFEAFDFAWLDEDTYIATKGISGPSGADGFATFTGSVGGVAWPLIPGNYSQIVAGPAGVVALKLNDTGMDHYVIWSRSGVGSPRDGVPVAFSPDGSLLAVVHYPRACCAGLPSPEPTNAPGPTTLDIVRTDTGKSVRSTGDIVFAYGLGVSFNPDGRMVAFRRDTPDGHEDLAILNIVTGQVWVVQSGGLSILPQQTLAWLDSTHLDLRSAGPTATEPAGFNLVVTHWLSDVAARSVSSRGDVATARTGSPQIDIQSGGKLITRSLPRVFDDLQLLWSPDGSTLMAVCSAFDSGVHVPDQVVILRP